MIKDITPEEIKCILKLIGELRYDAWYGNIQTDPNVPKHVSFQESHDAIEDWVEYTVKPFLIEIVRENNRLKEQADSLKLDLYEKGEENRRLKEELRRFQVLQYTPNEIEIKLNMLTVLKNGYNEYNEKHFGELCDNLLDASDSQSFQRVGK